MPNKTRRAKAGSINFRKRKDYIDRDIIDDNIIINNNNINNNNLYCRICGTFEVIDYGDFKYDSNDDDNYNETIDSDEEPDIIEIEYNLSDEVETNFCTVNAKIIEEYDNYDVDLSLQPRTLYGIMKGTGSSTRTKERNDKKRRDLEASAVGSKQLEAYYFRAVNDDEYNTEDEMNVAIIDGSINNTSSPIETRNLIVRNKKEKIEQKIKECIAKLMSNELNITNVK